MNFFEKLTVALKNQRHATRAGGLLWRDYGRRSQGQGVFELSGRSDCADAETGIANDIHQATAQRRQQRHGLSAKAAAHYARVRHHLAETAHGHGRAAEERFHAVSRSLVSNLGIYRYAFSNRAGLDAVYYRQSFSNREGLARYI
jgi:hypothetical protein